MALKLNERYPGRFSNPSTDYPQGSFKNRTTPTAKDGSYLEKDWANDKEGFFQSLIKLAGIDPNGSVDKVGNSQYLDAMLQLGQIQAGLAFTAGGTSTAVTLAPSPAISAYATGQRFCVTFSVSSGANPTINVSAKGAKNLKQYDSSGAKVAAAFAAGQMSDLVYDGTDFVLMDQPQSVVQATETVAGVIRKSTSAEATGGASDVGALTPLKAKAIFAARGIWDVSVISTNANTARAVGIYSLNSATNGPDGGVGAYQMLSSDSGNDPTWQVQLAQGVALNRLFMRSIKKDQSAVTPWDEIYSTSNNNMVGASVGFYLNSPPAGWLKENGAAVSRTTYAKLFAVIGTAFGAGDGATTFNLPDHRGEFPRGTDDGRNVDPGRLVGSAQAQAIQSHSHVILNKAVTFSFSAGGGGSAPGGTATGATELTGGTETRPRNIAKLYCIKY